MTLTTTSNMNADTKLSLAMFVDAVVLSELNVGRAVFDEMSIASASVERGGCYESL